MEEERSKTKKEKMFEKLNIMKGHISDIMPAVMLGKKSSLSPLNLDGSKNKRKKELIDKFKRTLNRLKTLKKFSEKLGIEFDVETIDISLLTLGQIREVKIQ